MRGARPASLVMIACALLWASAVCAEEGEEPTSGSPATVSAHSAAASPIPYREASVLTPERLLRVGIALGLGVGLLLIGSRWLRRMMGGGAAAEPGARRLAVLETHSLAVGTGLLLVRAGNRELLLSRSKEGLSLLADLGELDRGPDPDTSPLREVRSLGG